MKLEKVSDELFWFIRNKRKGIRLKQVEEVVVDSCVGCFFYEDRRIECGHLNPKCGDKSIIYERQ